MVRKGKLILISGPSGSGKTTLRDMLLEKHPSIKFSVSFTTREKRPGEVHGKDYFYVEQDEFERMIENNEFIEWAKVFEQYKGTSKTYVNELLEKGFDVLLEIDVQGGENVLNQFSELCSIFILPPSIETLKERFLKRGTDDEEQTRIRMETALRELEKKDLYKFWVVNDKLDEAYNTLETIITRYLENE